MSIIEVKNLSHSFVNGNKKLLVQDRRQILNNVSFDINEGEIVGLQGKNGVGKTTLIRIMSGLIKPDGGTIKIDNLMPVKNQRKLVTKFGVLFVKPSQLNKNFRVREALELNRMIFNMDKEWFDKRLKFYLELMELEEILENFVLKLSLGQRRKLELMNILLHNPKILLLDEPTIGVDITAKEAIRNCLLQLNQTENLTIFFTSHDEGDMRSLANRCLKLENGVINDDI